MSCDLKHAWLLLVLAALVVACGTQYPEREQAPDSHFGHDQKYLTGKCITGDCRAFNRILKEGIVFRRLCTRLPIRDILHAPDPNISGIRDYPLSRPPLPGSISAYVNGQEVPQAGMPGGVDGWTFYPDSNTVYFGDNVVPGYEAFIEIYYNTCSCP